MEDKNQTLSQRKPLNEDELETARSLARSPDHPIARSPDDPISSLDRSIPRTPDSTKCRECLGAMAHRLAQPMTALHGSIELGLMGKRSAADYRSVLEQSLQLADNLTQLIVSLRDLGESSAPRGAPRCVLLNAMAMEVVAEMEGLAETRDLHLHLQAGGNARVCADPDRLREALQSLLAWIIQNCAGDGVIAMELSAPEKEARIFLSPPRLDLQYLQIKVLEDITTPGLLFSRAAKNGALGWAINQRLWEGLGGRLEILTDGPDAGCVRVSFPLAPGPQGTEDH
jgi:C4-dicarboxylate-specific signal transduction histidine kinase